VLCHGCIASTSLLALTASEVTQVDFFVKAESHRLRSSSDIDWCLECIIICNTGAAWDNFGGIIWGMHFQQQPNSIGFNHSSIEAPVINACQPVLASRAKLDLLAPCPVPFDA
jgi:hypothetical protein